MTTKTYDRAARRVADNRHGNTPTGDYQPTDDDVARATYPDPKARHLKIAEGSPILAEKYELAEQDRAASGDLDNYTRPKTGKKTSSKDSNTSK